MGLLAIIEIGYGERPKLAKLERATWNRIRAEIPSLRMNEWTEEKVAPPYWYGTGEDMLIDLETDGKVLVDLGIDFKVKRFKGAYFADDSVGRYQTQVPFKSEVNAQTIVQVSIPDLALLTIKEVQVLEDAWTDELNRHLQEGWRIVAVCPPNSQRRPDYILGRA